MRVRSVPAFVLALCVVHAGAAEAAIRLAITVTGDGPVQEQLAGELRRRVMALADVEVVPREAADFSLDVIVSETGDGYVAAAEFSALFTRAMALRLLSAVDHDRAASLVAWLQTFDQERWKGVYAFPDPGLLAEQIVANLDDDLRNLRAVAPPGETTDEPK